ncbi:hypothetical protein U9M48_037548 [Paspalum notatum var. saurae]|uniref:Uncharacterized protein n=1 Tax=Paspalum notatum var. saurae TaxID=547442 RepID=A0AAQ3XA45_PASNO
MDYLIQVLLFHGWYPCNGQEPGNSQAANAALTRRPTHSPGSPLTDGRMAACVYASRPCGGRLAVATERYGVQITGWLALGLERTEEQAKVKGKIAALCGQVNTSNFGERMREEGAGNDYRIENAVPFGQQIKPGDGYFLSIVVWVCTLEDCLRLRRPPPLMEALREAVAKLTVYVHPSNTADVHCAIARQLSALLFSYEDRFDGVLLAHEAKIEGGREDKAKGGSPRKEVRVKAKILNGLVPYFGVQVQANLPLYSPQPDMILVKLFSFWALTLLTWL